MTLVVKLGSSIVADDAGEVRADVLDSVCAQVAELHHGGEDVAMVTSGAIALGMRVMELPQRPRAIDELQAASAVGQGSLFRAYESRLAERDVHAAQVLLTSFDLSVRMHYLNARQALRRLLDWRVVPVVNENDTTATDEITFGDNDFLSAQVALLLDARLLVLLTDIAGPAHGRSRAATRRRGWSSGSTTSPSSTRYEIGDRTSPFGSGGMRSKVAAAEMASAAGIPATICDGTAARHAAGGRPRRARSGPGFAPTPSGPRRSSSGCATRSRRAGGSRSTPAPRGCCASAARACCRSGSPRSRASSPPATRSRSSATGRWSARGSSTTRPPSCGRSRA